MSIPPLKNAPSPNADALCGHIPGQRAFTADVHTVAGKMLPLTLPRTTTSRAVIFAATRASPANRDSAVRHVDRPLHVAVDVQRFRTCQFALDLQALANRGQIRGCSRCGGGAGRIRFRDCRTDTRDSIGSSLEGEGVPGWVCSLLMITLHFSQFAVGIKAAGRYRVLGFRCGDQCSRRWP